MVRVKAVFRVENTISHDLALFFSSNV